MTTPRRLQSSDYVGFLIVGLTLLPLTSFLVMNPDSLVAWILCAPWIVVGGVLWLRRWRQMRAGTPRL